MDFKVIAFILNFIFTFIFSQLLSAINIGGTTNCTNFNYTYPEIISVQFLQKTFSSSGICEDMYHSRNFLYPKYFWQLE